MNMIVVTMGRPHSLHGAARWLVALGLGLAAMAASAADDPPGRVGRVGEMRGQVWMMEAGQGEWMPLVRNRPFISGDHLSTENGARAELQVGSTTLRLGGHTDVQVVRLDDDRIELRLNDGSLTLRVREPEVANEVEVQTVNGRFTPRMPGFYRLDQSARGSQGEAVSGELQFSARDSGLAVRAGQRADFWVDPGDRATHYSWAQPANDDLQQWARAEDQRYDRYVAGNPYVSPEMTGAGELERYGQWSNTPEYGAIWAPVVDPGWAPYRYGHWAWVSPWGWTWMDDAPWGFAPFHYGRWVFWGERWCWAPGRREPHPVYAPALVAWVGNDHFGASLRVGAGPAVGWIPLAPREIYVPTYRASPVYLEHINREHGRWEPERRGETHAPVMYTNRGVPGGITVVPAQALSQRQPVAVAPQRAPDEMVNRAWRGDRAQPIVPPAPQINPALQRGGSPPPQPWSDPHRPPVSAAPAPSERQQAPQQGQPQQSRSPAPNQGVIDLRSAPHGNPSAANPAMQAPTQQPPAGQPVQQPAWPDRHAPAGNGTGAAMQMPGRVEAAPQRAQPAMPQQAQEAPRPVAPRFNVEQQQPQRPVTVPSEAARQPRVEPRAPAQQPANESRRQDNNGNGRQDKRELN